MDKISIKSGRVVSEKGKLYTVTEYPKIVYGERITKSGKKSLRTWEPKRSKLSAAIRNGLRNFPFLEDSSVLYLGASTGTTVSHISDICSEGMIFAVEFSTEPFSKLLELSRDRQNIYPVFSTARSPENYSLFIERDPEIIYQDISQKDQLRILLRNMQAFPGWNYAMLMLKAISIDSSRNPEAVMREQEALLRKERNISILETVNIGNFHRGHFCIVMKNNRIS